MWRVAKYGVPLGIYALHLTHSSVHTQKWEVNKHTHTPWTHTRSNGKPVGARGAVGVLKFKRLLHRKTYKYIKMESSYFKL